MGNVIKFGGNSNLPTDPSSLANLGVAVAPTANVGGGDALLRLLRDGIWVFGADNVEPEADSQWAVNPYSFEHGFIAWHDSKVQGEVMVPVMSPLPNRHELPTVDGSWDDQLALQLQCVSGEDKGVQVMFKSTSVGGKKAIGALAAAIANKASSGDEAVVPVVLLETDSYQHKKYGKIYTPELTVVQWLSPAGEAAPTAEPASETEEAPKPRGRTRRR